MKSALVSLDTRQALSWIGLGAAIAFIATIALTAGSAFAPWQ